MLALDVLSADMTALLYALAFFAFVLAAVFSWPWRNWHFLVSVGLALWMFVQAYNAVAVA
jgi:hypothetical protein